MRALNQNRNISGPGILKYELKDTEILQSHAVIRSIVNIKISIIAVLKQLRQENLGKFSAPLSSNYNLWPQWMLLSKSDTVAL